MVYSTATRRTALRFGCALAAAAALAAPALVSATGPLYGSTYPSKASTKLFRGVGNVLFCWVELPLEINREIQNTDNVSGVFVGTGQGLWYTVRRFALGAVDVATFPVDVYDNNYQSVQRTEFPFIDEVE
ncbi:MAG: exosortase system-associated protein, TIGR04073 family [Candidatus Sumerlaeia bacterium]|nr:exosortase system-associated protein, TIGR04073 family [Candidatus Sumerlaeia bacterium]